MNVLSTESDHGREAEELRRRYGDHAAVEASLRRIQPGYRSVLLPGMRWGEEPVIISEFGGITCPADGDDQQWRGYATARDADELLRHYRTLVDALLDSPALAGFCYTQLTDVQQERNGLLTAERTPKLGPDVVRRITRRRAAGVPADEIGADEYDDHPLTWDPHSRDLEPELGAG